MDSKQPEDRHVGSPAACSITQSRTGDLTVLCVTGEVDAVTAPALQQAVTNAARTSPKALVVDLSEVSFLASAGMSVLVVAREEMATAGAVVVVADGPATSRPLKLVGLDEVIPIFATLQDAIQSLNA